MSLFRTSRAGCGAKDAMRWYRSQKDGSGWSGVVVSQSWRADLLVGRPCGWGSRPPTHPTRCIGDIAESGPVRSAMEEQPRARTSSLYSAQAPEGFWPCLLSLSLLLACRTWVWLQRATRLVGRPCRVAFRCGRSVAYRRQPWTKWTGRPSTRARRRPHSHPSLDGMRTASVVARLDNNNDGGNNMNIYIYE